MKQKRQIPAFYNEVPKSVLSGGNVLLVTQDMYVGSGDISLVFSPIERIVETKLVDVVDEVRKGHYLTLKKGSIDIIDEEDDYFIDFEGKEIILNGQYNPKRRIITPDKKNRTEEGFPIMLHRSRRNCQEFPARIEFLKAGFFQKNDENYEKAFEAYMGHYSSSPFSNEWKIALLWNYFKKSGKDRTITGPTDKEQLEFLCDILTPQYLVRFPMGPPIWKD